MAGGDGVEGGFAAEAATAGGEDVAGEGGEVDGGGRAEEDVNDVAGGVGGGGALVDLEDIGGGGDDALGEEEAGGELRVVAGGAHGEGDGAAFDADFERFFEGDGVVERRGIRGLVVARYRAEDGEGRGGHEGRRK